MRAADPIPRIDGVDSAAALLEYRGAARELVARVKYRNRRAAIAWLADGIAALVPRGVDAVTWAPANRMHVRTRGFDHGRLLATAVARRVGLPVVYVLRRADDAPLTGRTAAERAASLRLESVAPSPAAVLLVDDVITSGATLRAAAAVLRSAGARTVHAVAAAYTPPPGVVRTPG